MGRGPLDRVGIAASCVGVVSLLGLAMVQTPPLTAAPPHRPVCAEGNCPARPSQFGFYQTQWRRWPGDPPPAGPNALDQAVAPSRPVPTDPQAQRPAAPRTTVVVDGAQLRPEVVQARRAENFPVEYELPQTPSALPPIQSFGDLVGEPVAAAPEPASAEATASSRKLPVYDHGVVEPTASAGALANVPAPNAGPEQAALMRDLLAKQPDPAATSVPAQPLPPLPQAEHMAAAMPHASTPGPSRLPAVETEPQRLPPTLPLEPATPEGPQPSAAGVAVEEAIPASPSRPHRATPIPVVAPQPAVQLVSADEPVEVSGGSRLPAMNPLRGDDNRYNRLRDPEQPVGLRPDHRENALR